MLNAENLRDAEPSKNIEQRRLAWRCRRGMLELDIVLQRFIELHFYDLNMQELAAFDVLLEMPDNEFWNLLQNKNIGKDANQQAIINKLNAI